MLILVVAGVSTLTASAEQPFCRLRDSATVIADGRCLRVEAWHERSVSGSFREDMIVTDEMRIIVRDDAAGHAHVAWTMTRTFAVLPRTESGHVLICRPDGDGRVVLAIVWEARTPPIDEIYLEAELHSLEVARGLIAPSGTPLGAGEQLSPDATRLAVLRRWVKSDQERLKGASLLTSPDSLQLRIHRTVLPDLAVEWDRRRSRWLEAVVPQSVVEAVETAPALTPFMPSMR